MVLGSNPLAELIERSRHWVEVSEGIKVGCGDSMAELYVALSKTMSYGSRFRVGERANDVIHEAFLAVVEAIRRNQIRDPNRLMGFARTVLRRQETGNIKIAVYRRAREIDIEGVAELRGAAENPERAHLRSEHTQLMRLSLLP
jgi:RNA polymerase sigma-70 factor, ECF subfamily